MRAVLAVLIVAIAVAIVLPVPSGGPLPAYAVEADLRWSVARVVTEVERFRMTRGRLPAPAEIGVLLSDAVEYEPFDGLYLIVGEREDVRVEYDGTIPLAQWRALKLYASERGP